MNYFYNIASIVIGIILLIYGTINIANKKDLLFNIIVIIFGVVFITLGVLFLTVIPSQFEWISTVILATLSIILVIMFLVANKNTLKSLKETNVKINLKYCAKESGFNNNLIV